MSEASTIERAGRVLADAAHTPARVILFGSGARGEAGNDSDLDFLVIERSVDDSVAEAVHLRRALGDIGVPVDIIVLDEVLAARRAKVPGTRVHNALRDGREGHFTASWADAREARQLPGLPYCC
ncbi:MAG: nucleotidyltransferase domain-containing protein [Solirubrobacteraceae bacterium]